VNSSVDSRRGSLDSKIKDIGDARNLERCSQPGDATSVLGTFQPRRPCSIVTVIGSLASPRLCSRRGGSLPKAVKSLLVGTSVCRRIVRAPTDHRFLVGAVVRLEYRSKENSLTDSIAERTALSAEVSGDKPYFSSALLSLPLIVPSHFARTCSSIGSRSFA
jgi:hypothetical protein